MTTNELRLLALMRDTKGLRNWRVRELARVTGIKAPVVADLVASMARRGYVAQAYRGYFTTAKKGVRVCGAVCSSQGFEIVVDPATQFGPWEDIRLVQSRLLIGGVNQFIWSNR